MPHFVASDLGQLSLPISDKKDARLFKDLQKFAADISFLICLLMEIY